MSSSQCLEHKGRREDKGDAGAENGKRVQAHAERADLVIQDLGRVQVLERKSTRHVPRDVSCWDMNGRKCDSPVAPAGEACLTFLGRFWKC